MKALILDDRAEDAELLVQALQKSGLRIDWRHASNRSEYEQFLGWEPDVVLADYSLPGFDAPEALRILTERGRDIPFIVVSGSVGEEAAVLLLKQGAADYLLKDRLTRVGLAVSRALEVREQRRATQAAERRLRDAEERTRFTLEASRVGVWEVDLSTGRSTWSETLESLHGLAPGTFGGTFDAFVALIHPDDRQSVGVEIETATREHTDSNILYRCIWPDGSVRWIRGRGRTFYDDNGVPIRAAGVGYDVTEIHALESQYRQAQKMEAVGQLAGGMAHDFNNVLTIIKGFCNLAMEEPGNALKPELQQILTATDRAATLTRQLLAFSRRQIFEESVFDMRDTLRGITPMLQTLIGETIQVVTHASPQPCRVKSDAAQIEHVIMNLAVNARDAMPDGGRLIFELRHTVLDKAYARGRPEVRPGRYVLLSVTDTGVGMDSTTLERIFEPFFTTKPKDKGTGLGLATVYGVVKQTGGHVSVYSEPGMGSTFKVFLPAADQSTRIEVEPPRPRAGVDRGDEAILVVEDDEGVRMLVAEVLNRRGYRTHFASSPDEALKMIDSLEGLDLLLTDMVLPTMSGRALAGRLTAMRPAMRVLYMSGYTGEAMVSYGSLDPGAAFIEKPFAPEQLARKVREVLDS